MKFISNKLLFALFSIGVFGSGALNGSEMKRPYGYGTEHRVTIASLEELGQTMVNNAVQYGRDPSSNLLTLAKNMPYISMQKETDLDDLLTKIDGMGWMEWPPRLNTPEFQERLQQGVLAAKNAIVAQLENLAKDGAASRATREAAKQRAEEMRNESERAEKEQQQSRQFALDRAEKEATQQLFAQAEGLREKLSRFRNTAEMNMYQGLRDSNFYREADTLINTLDRTREFPATLRVALNDSTRAFEQLKQRFALAQRQQQARKRWKRAGDQVRATTRFQAGGKRAEQARLEEQRREQARLEAQRREEARRDARRTELSEQGAQTIAERTKHKLSSFAQSARKFARSKIATRTEAARLEQLRIEQARLEAQRLAREAQQREEQLKREARLAEQREEQLEREARLERETQEQELRFAQEAQEKTRLDAEEQEFAAKLGRDRSFVAENADRLRAEKIARNQFKVPVQSQSRDVSGAEGMWGGKGAHQTNTTGRAKELKTAANPEQQYLVNDIIISLQAIKAGRNAITKFNSMNNFSQNISMTKVSKVTDVGWELLRNRISNEEINISLLQEAASNGKITDKVLQIIVDRLNIR